MESVKDIKGSIKKLTVESSDKIHSRVLGKLLRSLDKSKKQTAVKQANTGRIIMKSRIAKLAVAAVVIVAVMVGINQLGGSIDMASVAWAEITTQLDRVGYVHCYYFKSRDDSL